MLSKNNFNEMLRKGTPKKQRFGLRKLSVGVASILLGFTFMGISASADTTEVSTGSQANTALNGSSSNASTEVASQGQQEGNSALKLGVNTGQASGATTNGQEQSSDSSNTLNVQPVANNVPTAALGTSQVQESPTHISNYQGLLDALKDKNINNVVLDQDIDASSLGGMVDNISGSGIARTVTIDGNNHALNMGNHYFNFAYNNETNSANWSFVFKNFQNLQANSSWGLFWLNPVDPSKDSITFENVHVDESTQKLISKVGQKAINVIISNDDNEQNTFNGSIDANNVNVSGNNTINSAINANGDVSFTGTNMIAGPVSANNVIVSGDNNNVNGSITAKGDVFFAGTNTIKGLVTGNNVSFAGTNTLNGQLNVSEALVTAKGNLIFVDGNTTVMPTAVNVDRLTRNDRDRIPTCFKVTGNVIVSTDANLSISSAARNVAGITFTKGAGRQTIENATSGLLRLNTNAKVTMNMGAGESMAITRASDIDLQDGSQLIVNTKMDTTGQRASAPVELDTRNADVYDSTLHISNNAKLSIIRSGVSISDSPLLAFGPNHDIGAIADGQTFHLIVDDGGSLNLQDSANSTIWPTATSQNPHGWPGIITMWGTSGSDQIEITNPKLINIERTNPINQRTFLIHLDSAHTGGHLSYIRINSDSSDFVTPINMKTADGKIHTWYIKYLNNISKGGDFAYTFQQGTNWTGGPGSRNMAGSTGDNTVIMADNPSDPGYTKFSDGSYSNQVGNRTEASDALKTFISGDEIKSINAFSWWEGSSIAFGSDLPVPKDLQTGWAVLPDARDAIKNADELPNDNQYSWLTEPDVGQAGQTVNGVVRVTYGNGIYYDVPVSVTVGTVTAKEYNVVWQGDTVPTSASDWVASGAPAGATVTFDGGTPDTNRLAGSSEAVQLTVHYNSYTTSITSRLFVRALPVANMQVVKVGDTLTPNNSWISNLTNTSTTPGVLPIGLVSTEWIDANGNPTSAPDTSKKGEVDGYLLVRYEYAPDVTHVMKVPIIVYGDGDTVTSEDNSIIVWRTNVQEWHRTDSDVPANETSISPTGVIYEIDRYENSKMSDGTTQFHEYNYQYDSQTQTYSDGSQSFNASGIGASWNRGLIKTHLDHGDDHGTETLHNATVNALALNLSSGVKNILGIKDDITSINVTANFYGSENTQGLVVDQDGYQIVVVTDSQGHTKHIRVSNVSIKDLSGTSAYGKDQNEIDNFIRQYVSTADLNKWNQEWKKNHPNDSEPGYSMEWVNPSDLDDQLKLTGKAESTPSVVIHFKDTPNNPLTISIPLQVYGPTKIDETGRVINNSLTTYETVNPDLHKISNGSSQYQVTTGQLINSFNHYNIEVKDNAAPVVHEDGTYTYQASDDSYHGTNAQGQSKTYAASDLIVTWDPANTPGEHDETLLDKFGDVAIVPEGSDNTGTVTADQLPEADQNHSIFIQARTDSDLYRDITHGGTDEKVIKPNFYGATTQNTVNVDKQGNIKDLSYLSGKVTDSNNISVLNELINISDLYNKFGYTLEWAPGVVDQIQQKLADPATKTGTIIPVTVRVKFTDGSYLDVKGNLKVSFTEADNYDFSQGRSIWIMQGDQRINQFIDQQGNNAFSYSNMPYPMKLGQLNFWTNKQTGKLEKLNNVTYQWVGTANTIDPSQPGWYETANTNGNSVLVTFDDGSTATFRLDVLVLAQPIMLPINVPTGYVIDNNSGSLLIADYGKGAGYINSLKWLQRPNTSVAGQATGRAVISYDTNVYKRDSNGKIIYTTDATGKKHIPVVDTTAHPAFGKLDQSKLNHYVLNVNNIDVIDGDFIPTIVRGTTSTLVIKQNSNGTVTNMKFIDNKTGNVRDDFALNKQGQLTDSKGQQLFSTTTNTLKINHGATVPTSEQLRQVLNTRLLDSFGVNYMVSPENLQLDKQTGQATGDVKLQLGGVDFTMPLKTSFTILPDTSKGDSDKPTNPGTLDPVKPSTGDYTADRDDNKGQGTSDTPSTSDKQENQGQTGKDNSDKSESAKPVTGGQTATEDNNHQSPVTPSSKAPSDENNGVTTGATIPGSSSNNQTQSESGIRGANTPRWTPISQVMSGFNLVQKYLTQTYQVVGNMLNQVRYYIRNLW